MRICVVDDHEIVREGLRTVLGTSNDIEVVAEADTAAGALTAVRRSVPDVVLTDFRLPDMPGDELCRRIREIAPSTAVVILTTYLSENIVQRSIDAGAAGFVTKAAGLDELRRVLSRVRDNGATPMRNAPSTVVQLLHQTAGRDVAHRALTPQQERVLELAASGLTYREIGRQLHVSESTVRFHIQSLKERLGVKTKTELIALAIREALIAPGTDACLT
jgi:DNA-binding NarL/FixJ family response regulator